MEGSDSLLIAMAPGKVREIAVVGTGTIGAAWAAHFLAQGFNVIAADPNPGADERVRSVIKKAWPVLAKLGLASGASPDRLRFTSSIDNAVKNADFVQESTPERETIKDEVIAAISKTAAPHVVIASSTSGIIPSRLQRHCKNPERLIVGHPFNPVYLIPLVEVVGGRQTSPETIQWAIEFYRRINKTPLHCRVETPGHIANRLQDAVFAEAMQLIADEVANPEEIDLALTAGPGLRWALLGPFLLGHMAAGKGGLRDIIGGKFGENYHCDFQGPGTLTEKILEMVVDNTVSQIGDRSPEFLEKIRDEFLVGVLKLRAEIEAKDCVDQDGYSGSFHP